MMNNFLAVYATITYTTQKIQREGTAEIFASWDIKPLLLRKKEGGEKMDAFKREKYRLPQTLILHHDH
jgi:hypothetical protein